MPSGTTEYVQLSLEELEALKPLVDDQTYLNAVYASYPSVWMETMLKSPVSDDPLVLRDYQREMADNPNRFKIARLGRQTGKTVVLAATAVWRAVCFPYSKIAIVAPRETQVKHIGSLIRNFIEKANPLVKMVYGGARSQPVEFWFNNGSIIRGFTVSKESAVSGGSSIRGQPISDLFIDEADYIEDETMETTVMPTTTNFPQRTVWMSSTPTGRVGFFYKEWHTGRYATFHYSSRINPNWTQEMEDRIQRLDKATMMHEYLAEWYTGEAGVFHTDQIENMQNSHSKIMPGPRSYSYSDRQTLLDRSKYRFIGVDWNKRHGTRIVVITVDQTGKICLIHKERIGETEFQFHDAVNRIRELDKIYNPTFISVDVGHGDMQIEELRLTTVKNPLNEIGKKVIGVETGGMMTITDILTGDERQTYVKNFLVKQTARCLEQGILTLPTEEFMFTGNAAVQLDDLTLADQMRNYYIDKVSYDGREVYACRSDHDLDALMFALYAYITKVLKINNLYDLIPLAKSVVVPMAVNKPDQVIDNGRIPLVSTSTVHRHIIGPPKNRKSNLVKRSLGFGRTRSIYG